MLFNGAMTAIITPFKNGRVDDAAFIAMIDRQITEGIDAIVVCGTTGESATLEESEKHALISLAVDRCTGRVPVIAGAGSNSTAHAISLSRLAKSAGANATLQITPYYNKPMPHGLYLHFRAIAESVDIPMILYNVPSRTGVNMPAETSVRLSSVKNIIGIKEASGNLDQIREIRENTPNDFGIYSGEDAMNLEIYKLGGNGCISVTSNVVPNIVSSVWDKFKTGDLGEAETTQSNLSDLNDAMFFETNPIPVKTALASLGLCHDEFRLPLTEMSEIEKSRLIDVLKRYRLV